MLYDIERHFTLPDGRTNKAVVLDHAKAEMRLHGTPRRRAFRNWLMRARFERKTIPALIRANEAYELRLVAEQEDAEQLAAEFDFDEYRLMEQRNIWQGKIGSRFGAQQEYERFCRALKLARARQAQAERAA